MAKIKLALSAAIRHRVLRAPLRLRVACAVTLLPHCRTAASANERLIHTSKPPPWVFFVAGAICIPAIVLHPPLHRTEKEKPRYRLNSMVSLCCLVGRAGLEPATKGL